MNELLDMMKRLDSLVNKTPLTVIEKEEMTIDTKDFSFWRVMAIVWTVMFLFCFWPKSNDYVNTTISANGSTSTMTHISK